MKPKIDVSRVHVADLLRLADDPLDDGKMWTVVKQAVRGITVKPSRRRLLILTREIGRECLKRIE